MKNFKIGSTLTAVKPWLIPVGLLVFVFLFGKKVLQQFGLIPDESIEKRRKAAENAIVDTINALTVSGVKSSQPPAYWASLANSVYEDLRFSAISDNKFMATTSLKKCMTDVDVYMLADKFGFRQEYYFGLPVGSLQDLVTFVTGNLFDSQIDSINNTYKSRGMKFRF